MKRKKKSMRMVKEKSNTKITKSRVWAALVKFVFAFAFEFGAKSKQKTVRECVLW